MKYFLIEQSCNYADEFDMEGFWVDEGITEQEVLDKILNNFIEENGDFPVESYFGSNEAMIFEDESEYLDTISIKEITKNDYDVIINILGGGYGQTF